MLLKSCSPFVVIWRAIVGWWENLILLTVLSLAWLLCWFTVVLGPPATFGLYCALDELARENTTTFRTALDGARRHFLPSWLWMFANLLAGALLALNWSFYGGIENTIAYAIRTLTVWLAFFWVGIQFYALPFYFLQEKPSLWLAWRNAAYTAMSSLLRAMLIWAATLLLFVGGVLLVLPLLLGMPALVALMGSLAVRERLITYGLLKPVTLEPEDKSAEDR